MNPKELLQNAGKMQEEIERIQNEVMKISAEGSSGGKMVSVTMNGRMEITAVHIDPICVDKRDVKMLEDLIVSASHAAMERVKDEVKERLGFMPKDALI